MPVLALGGSFRYTGLAWPQTFEPPAFPGRSREADAFVSWEARPWLRVGGTGGFAEDTSSRAARRWVGPEATFPRLLWGRGTLSAGYLEENGWISGRSAYGQVMASPWKPVALLARLAWSHEQVGGPFQDEAALTLGGRAELNQFLAVRLTLSGRTAVGGSDAGGTRPYGLAAFATLQAGF